MSFRDRDQGQNMQPPLPKPYDFVPLSEQRPQLAPPAGHERYQEQRLTGQISGRLVAQSDLHVASGLLQRRPDDRQYPLVKAHMRTNGCPVIPGTSLKGCIRAIVEAISPSVIHVTKASLNDDDMRFRPGRGERTDAKKHIVALDPAARLFGAQGYLGSVRFSDALLEAGETVVALTPQLYAPRPKAHDTYFDGRRVKGRKFYMHGDRAQGNLPLEACPPGSRFAFTADFENVSAAEVGLLLTALGIGTPRFYPKLGGAKPACLGTIAVEDVTVRLFQPRNSYINFQSQCEPCAIAPLLESGQAQGLVLETQLQHLVALLAWPVEDRACPDRSY